MSIIVNGVKKPDSCAVCRFAGKGGYHMERVVCMFTGKNEDAKNVDRLSDCPLVALPDKHGRLIDERVAELCIGDHMIGFAGREGRSYWQRVHDGLADAPNIVEAEGE